VAGGVEGERPAPGTVLACEPALGLVVATGGCPLLVRQAQRAGKRSAEGSTLIQQLEARVGDQLGC
jgi:methionyl-tRNA formyltransferase